mmetsp:Transcript_45439/g.81749  ORF Transcript_45439/g.81749 Transcript_45439/m.81749 type:complete len:508 (-) Transcript_45439:210-1733(-)
MQSSPLSHPLLVLRFLEDLLAYLGTCLIHDIDGLVRKKAIRDVLRGEFHGCFDGLRRVSQLMMLLIPWSQASQDLFCLILRWLRYKNWLEASLKCRVLFDVLPVLIQRCCTDALELTTCQCRLQQICGIHASTFSSAAASTNQCVHLVNDQNDTTIALCDLLNHSPKALLEVTTVPCSCEQQGQIQRQDALILQSWWHAALNDSLSQATGDGCLTHTGLANVDRIVLGPAAQDSNRSLQLCLTAHQGIQFAFFCRFGEVLSILQRLGEFQLGLSSWCHAASRSLCCTRRRGSTASRRCWSFVFFLEIELGKYLVLHGLWRVGKKQLPNKLGSKTVVLAQQCSKQVSRTHRGTVFLSSHFNGLFKNLLGALREGNFNGLSAWPLPDHLLQLLTSLIQLHACSLQGLAAFVVAFCQNAHNQHFSANSIVAKLARLCLSHHHRLHGACSEALEHGTASHCRGDVLRAKPPRLCLRRSSASHCSDGTKGKPRSNVACLSCCSNLGADTQGC